MNGGFDFSGALRSGASSLGEAWQAGIDERQQQEDRRRAIAAAEVKMRQDAEDRARAEQTRTAIGDALRNGDYRAALGAAYAGGLDKVGDGLRTVWEKDFDHAEKGNTAFANIAAGVASLPYEQRRGAIASVAPRLAAMGIPQADIANFDPTDDNLAALAGIDYGQEKRVEHANTAYGNQTERIVAENPVVVGSSLVTRGGSELYRAPEYKIAGTNQSVIEVGGQESDGYSGTGTMTSDQVFDAMLGVESNTNHFNSDGSVKVSSAGAIGIAQVMPTTAPEAARYAGVPFNDHLYRTDPAYNRKLGKAYFEHQVEYYGGDLRKAAAAYNTGPRNVDRAIARAAQRGGDWTQYLPKQETRDYVTKVFGRRGTTRQTRVIQQGVPNPTRGSANGPNGKPLNTAQTKAITTVADSARSLQRLQQTFNDDFAGNIAGGMENTIQGVIGSFGTEGQQQWWADMGDLDNNVRHGLFGAALTPTEMAAWRSTTVSPRMDPKLVRQNLKRRFEIFHGATSRLARSTVAGGGNREAVRILVEDLGINLPASGAVQVRTRAEIEALPSGTVFQTPDGRTGRKR